MRRSPHSILTCVKRQYTSIKFSADQQGAELIAPSTGLCWLLSLVTIGALLHRMRLAPCPAYWLRPHVELPLELPRAEQQ